MKNVEMKKYQVRSLEIEAWERVCDRIDSFVEDTQVTIDRYLHQGDYSNLEEEIGDYDRKMAAAYKIRLQAYETALAAVMKLMGV